jgi:hypothetical protein
MDPFESEKIDPRTTGLVDNWRQKLAHSPNTGSPQSLTLHMPVIPERQRSPSAELLVMPTPLCVRLAYSLSLSLSH